jgi:oligopeptidase B
MVVLDAYAEGRTVPTLHPPARRRRERGYDANGSDETMLDLNELARGQAFLKLGLAAVSRDANRLAYTLDLTGGRDFTLHIRDLASGQDDAWSMAQVSSAAWANDSGTLYYVTMDAQSKRANRLWRHVVGPPARTRWCSRRRTSCSTFPSARPVTRSSWC